jgi:hypothetical protein
LPDLYVVLARTRLRTSDRLNWGQRSSLRFHRLGIVFVDRRWLGESTTDKYSFGERTTHNYSFGERTRTVTRLGNAYNLVLDRGLYYVQVIAREHAWHKYSLGELRRACSRSHLRSIVDITRARDVDAHILTHSGAGICLSSANSFAWRSHDLLGRERRRGNCLVYAMAYEWHLGCVGCQAPCSCIELRPPNLSMKTQEHPPWAIVGFLCCVPKSRWQSSLELALFARCPDKGHRVDLVVALVIHACLTPRGCCCHGSRVPCSVSRMRKT